MKRFIYIIYKYWDELINILEILACFMGLVIGMVLMIIGPRNYDSPLIMAIGGIFLVIGYILFNHIVDKKFK